MDDIHVGRYWNRNAEAWTTLARAGYDVYRDCLNTPAFLAMLPDIEGRVGLDLGCGEGHNTRLLAQRGAILVGVDIADRFLQYARQKELETPLGIAYLQGSGSSLPFAAETFDFVTAFMSLMDMPEPARVLSECHRVLKPGGFLQFSISHPCSDTPIQRKIKDAQGVVKAFVVGEYFQRTEGQIDEWTFSSAPPELRAQWPAFQVPRFTQPLSAWLNQLIDAGFIIKRVGEPFPDKKTIAQCPHIADASIWPYFLHIRCSKT